MPGVFVQSGDADRCGGCDAKGVELAVVDDPQPGVAVGDKGHAVGDGHVAAEIGQRVADVERAGVGGVGDADHVEPLEAAEHEADTADDHAEAAAVQRQRAAGQRIVVDARQQRRRIGVAHVHREIAAKTGAASHARRHIGHAIADGEALAAIGQDDAAALFHQVAGDGQHHQAMGAIERVDAVAGHDDVGNGGAAEIE